MNANGPFFVLVFIDGTPRVESFVGHPEALDQAELRYQQLKQGWSDVFLLAPAEVCACSALRRALHRHSPSCPIKEVVERLLRLNGDE